jgi:hypothetical protein
MFIKMSGGTNFLCFYVLCAETYAEGEEGMSFWFPLSYLEDMTTMYEKSWVSGLSTCIPGQESTADNTPFGGQEEDLSEEHHEE